jgi:2-C-methyl-D-erythritol 4-phosphate cytidylyltransferase/2-C-methyl-D-erythritol 2,4-cyclodiphosphate synthase
MSDRTRIAALIVAAGRGIRAAQDLPKQYVSMGGVPLLRRTVEAFLSHRSIDAVQVVISREDDALYRSATAGLSGLLAPAIGNNTRQKSVLNGLEALAGASPQMVLVHDAARPFVSAAVVDRVLAGCSEGRGAIPVVAVADALRRVNGESLEEISRDKLVAVQTPQGFPFALILAAHRAAARAGHTDLADDSAVAALAGLPVHAVAGDRRNVKLTEPEDFALAEDMLARSTETRCAQGFDVHAFGLGSSVRLCGVNIPYDKGLVGHSDADVGLHALTDALLGTIADADIGAHFPPSDQRFKDASSDRFLADAVQRLRNHGGRVLNLDVTLVCEAPKIAPHRDAMREAIAAIVGVSVLRVSVKATTSEKLGFTGRGEGVAAFAIATVELPRPP